MNVSRLVASVGGYFVLDGDRRRRLPPLRRHRRPTLDVDGRQGHAHARPAAIPGPATSASPSTPEAPQRFSLQAAHPRLGATAPRATVNGEPVDVAAAPTHGYLDHHARLAAGRRRRARPADAGRAHLRPPRASRVDVGRVALKRGPLVYCVEQADNPGGPVQQLALPRDATLDAEPTRDLFDGIVAMTAARRLDDGDWRSALYRAEPPKAAPATLTAIPYYLWANRGRGSMTVA